MARVAVFAPAKINLALHVVGQRADGYHLLDTLVAFASIGDRVVLDTDAQGFAIDGAEAAALDADADNLVQRAAAEFWNGAALGMTLTKNLPVSSGIGGGSADAAAAVRGMAWLRGQGGLPPIADDALAQGLLRLGADVPMCLTCRPARVTGIGEQIDPLPNLARLHVVLVNPRLAVATPQVFKALTQKENPALAVLPADLGDAQVLVDYLLQQRNDLQAPALAIAPQIGVVLQRLGQCDGLQLARMSGSGATCFGIFPTDQAAQAAADAIAQDRPDWWVRACLLDGQDRAAPQPLN